MSEWFSLLWDTIAIICITVIVMAVFIFALVLAAEDAIWKRVVAWIIMAIFTIAFFNTFRWAI
ncbi:hypothetical protein KC887_05090 [Candidatus Kaiserbacteria bacterium]|nr:hypothetical protein [Candidatus Kaiserbacteria bacterium]